MATKSEEQTCSLPSQASARAGGPRSFHGFSPSQVGMRGPLSTGGPQSFGLPPGIAIAEIPPDRRHQRAQRRKSVTNTRGESRRRKRLLPTFRSPSNEGGTTSLRWNQPLAPSLRQAQQMRGLEAGVPLRTPASSSFYCPVEAEVGREGCDGHKPLAVPRWSHCSQRESTSRRSAAPHCRHRVRVGIGPPFRLSVSCPVTGPRRRCCR